MKINKEWHQAHKMAKNPTPEQRKAWHQEHQKNCDCWKSYTKSEDDGQELNTDKPEKSSI